MRANFIPRKISRLFAIFILAFLVRAAPLGRYITPDEPIWVFRSVRFADAVAARQWDSIPQTGHPGLTTMVLGALGIRVTQVLYPVIAEKHLAWIRNMAWLSPENAEAFTHLAFFLPASRALVMGVTSLGITVVYVVARRRIRDKAARLLALFLALDPFFAGLAGLLHTDALQATFVMLAVFLCIENRESRIKNQESRIKTSGFALQYPEKNRNLNILQILLSFGSLVGAALCLALAGLTKTLGLLVAPGLALVMLLDRQDVWLWRVLRVALLAVLTIAFTLVLYPPFWSDPASALASLIGAAGYHEGIGLRDVFFLGEMTPEPGILFYPLVLLFRLTPAVLLGLVLAMKPDRFMRSRDAMRADDKNLLDLTSRASENLSGLFWFGIPALFYLVAISIATKKFDRYALSAIPLLTAVAALAWCATTSRWRWVLLAALLLPWAMVAPLPLYYANPLVGGPWLAQHSIPLGWGEATGLAASLADRTVSAPETRILMAQNVPGAAAFFSGETRAWDDAFLLCADVIVGEVGDLIIDNGIERQLHIAGIPLTILTQPSAPLPAEQCIPVLTGTLPYQARFAGALDLLASTWPASAHAPDALPVRLRWQPQSPLGDVDIHLALWDQDEQILWAGGGGMLVDDRIWRTSVWEIGRVIEGEAYIPLPLHMPPGIYTLALSLRNSEGQQLGLTLPDGTFGGTQLALGQVQIEPPPYPAPVLNLETITPVDVPGLRLIAVRSPVPVHWAGDKLPFSLGWDRVPGDASSVLHWMLTCAGETRSGGELALAPEDPKAWSEGHRYITHYAPRTDPLLMDGICELRVQVDETPSVLLGTVDVRARERDFALPRAPDISLTVGVGNFATLIGADVSQMSVTPGDALEVVVYWQARDAADLDYTTFIHLLGPEGAIDRRTWGQSDGWPDNGTAPTTSWVDGQVIVDRHILNVSADAPQGVYVLIVGLYDAQSGGRVPLYGESGERLPDDALLIAALSIVDK